MEEVRQCQTGQNPRWELDANSSIASTVQNPALPVDVKSSNRSQIPCQVVIRRRCFVCGTGLSSLKKEIIKGENPVRDWLPSPV
jgi:hypothetical protein